MIKLINHIKGFKPLVYIGDELILAKYNKLYIASLDLKEINYICSVGTENKLKLLFSKNRLLQRLFRLQLGPAIQLKQKDCFLVFLKNICYFVDIKNKKVIKEEHNLSIKKPLQMNLISKGKYKDCLIFGEYSLNGEFNPVDIYKRSPEGSYEKIFTFQKGEINHIHGIFEGPNQDNLYILTGDFKQGAGIWVGDINLNHVKPLFRGDQSTRTCWIKAIGNNLVFATDRQDAINYLSYFSHNETGNMNKIFPIVGSSIYYSSAHSKKIIFSTSVEPEPNSGSSHSLKNLLNTKRANGIISDHSCVYSGDLENGFEIIFSAKKDSLPYGLFQFGNISFPSGILKRQDYVHFYCMALSGHDDITYCFNFEDD
tara:strand:- start:15987 stop:17096 length:1110 start_codon:yes stop_codon:yes gene_type:complete